MGTMLAYVFTDANLPAAVLGPLVRRGEPLFNAITVDGDTSTNRHLPALRHRRRPQPADRAGG